jgi:hypothetical protein
MLLAVCPVISRPAGADGPELVGPVEPLPVIATLALLGTLSVAPLVGVASAVTLHAERINPSAIALATRNEVALLAIELSPYKMC